MWGGRLAAWLLGLLLVERGVAVSYVERVLTVRLRENLLQLMSQPFQPLEYTTESYDLSFLDLTSTEAVREWCYTEALATGTGTTSAIDMLYVGTEDGRFLGYFSPTSYTFKGTGSGAASDSELSWSPYALDTVNQHCDVIRCDRDTVSASCGAATYVGECYHWQTGSTVGTGDPGYGDQAACESAGNIWFAPCTTTGCCDSAIRNYYSTSRAARGAPVDFTRWRVYDHRVRPWYRAAIAKWLNDAVKSSWSTVYVFSTSGELGVTAMQTMVQADGTPDSVFAVDFELGSISGLLNTSLVGTGTAFAYIVETAPDYSGTLIGISTKESLQTSAGQRRRAVDASNRYIAESAAILASRNWPADRHIRYGAGSVGWEIYTQSVTALTRGLPWLVVAGQSISCRSVEIWNQLDGRCTRCPAGKQPEPVADRQSRWEMSGTTRSWDEWLQEEDGQHACVQCPAGYATLPGQEGVCVLCEDGTHPTPVTAANCDRCDLQSAGVGGHCHVCDKNRGEVPSDDSTECVCPAGTYDSWRPLLSTRPVAPAGLSSPNVSNPYHIFCWADGKNFVGPGDPGFKRVKKAYPDTLSDVSSLPDPGAGSTSPNFKQLEDLTMKGARRCIACPDCVQCAAKNGRNISIQEGWALLDDNSFLQDGGMYEKYGDNDLDVFKCETGACLAFTLSNTSVAANCKDKLRQAPLCTRCADMYTKTGDGECKQCHGDFDDPKTVWSLLFVGLCIVLVPFVWKCCLSKSIKDKVTLFLGTAERSWPRLRQSLNILIANYQISRRIAKNSGIEWGPAMQAFYERLGALSELDFLQLPGISCLTGNTFYARWVTKMCIMPAWAVVLYGVYRYQASKVGLGIDDPRELRRKQGKLNHDSGVLREIEDNFDSLSIKVKATVEIGHLRSRYAGIMFMVVYLMYPGVAAACFEMFHCRALEGGTDVNQLQLLKADMSLECWSLGGERSETYHIFSILGVIAVCIYPIGIPLFLGVVLFRNRKTIKKNPNYITLGGLRPMFIFYKSDCYLWEVYFMIQKVILVGFMGMIPRGALTNVVNVSVSIYMVTVLFKSRPSKTEEYNNANILSQIVILVTYMLAQYSRSIEADLDKDAYQLLVNRQTLVLGSIQGLMAAYLIYISTVKLRVFWTQQRDTIVKERQVSAEASKSASVTEKEKTEKEQEQSVRDLEQAEKKLRDEEYNAKMHCIKRLGAIVKPYGELRLPQGGAKELDEVLQQKIERIVLRQHTMICNASGKVTSDHPVQPGVFWLLSGQVNVFDRSPHSGAQPVDTISSGSVFGERTAVVMEDKPVAWLTAASRVEAFVLWGTDLAKVVERNPGAPPNEIEYRKRADDEGQLAELTQRMEDARKNVKEHEQRIIALKTKLKNTQRESQAALRTSFNVFDLDGDGSLSEKEICKVMKQMGQVFNDAELNLVQMVANTDGSGTIDFHEFKILWGSADLNSLPTKAWVGNIPHAAVEGLTQKQQEQKIISAFMHRKTSPDNTDWAFVKNTGQVGRLNGHSTKDVEKGGVTLHLAEGEEILVDASNLEPCKEPVAIILDATVWQERHKPSWAKVTFKGVHGLAIAIALNDEALVGDAALVICDPDTQKPYKLRVDAWSLQKEAALAARLAEDLQDWDSWKCTVMVFDINVQTLESAHLEREAKGRTGKYEELEEADKPITSGDFFKAQHPITGLDFGNVHNYEFKNNGPLGPGYYKLGALERIGSKAGLVGTVAAKSLGVAASASAAVGGLARTASTHLASAISRSTSQEDAIIERSSSREVGEVHDDPDFLRQVFSPFGTYLAGTVRVRGGSNSYALVTLGKAAVARVLTQPQPAQFQAYRLFVLDSAKLKRSDGVFKELFERHMEKVEKELKFLTSSQQTMWNANLISGPHVWSTEVSEPQPQPQPEPEPELESVWTCGMCTKEAIAGSLDQCPRCTGKRGRRPRPKTPPRSATPPRTGSDGVRTSERVSLLV